MLVNAVTIIVAIGLAGLGIALGFGRVLRFFTQGVFGFFISIFFCVSFGGAIAGIPAIRELIDTLNTKLGEAWEFLATIRLATIIYYVVLFLIFQLIRKLIVFCISGIFSANVLPMRLINRLFGAIFLVAVVFLLVLLVFAILALFDEMQAIQTFTENIQGTFLGTLYTNNPISFQ